MRLRAERFPADRCAGLRWRFSSLSPSRFRSSRCMGGWPTPTAKRRWRWRWWWPESWDFTRCCVSHVGLFPAQARAVAPVMVGLAVVGILYGACLALVQRDFWRLMAFAALSHLSLITLGIYGLTLTGWEGAVYQILNHGVVDGALFLLLGLLYERYATSEISAYGGLAAKLPRTATFFVLSTLGMIGLPILGGFVGEFLILLGTFHRRQQGLGDSRRVGRDSGRGLHALAGAEDLLWAGEPAGAVEAAGGFAAGTDCCLGAARGADLGDGGCADGLVAGD